MSATHLGTAQAHLRAAMEQLGAYGDARQWPTVLADLHREIEHAQACLARVDLEDCRDWLEREHRQRGGCDRAVAVVLDGEGYCVRHAPRCAECDLPLQPHEAVTCGSCDEREAARQRAIDERSLCAAECNR